MDKVITSLVIWLLIGCSSGLLPGIPTESPECIPGDKQAVWEEYEQWYGNMLYTRRVRQEYCDWKHDPHYALYCVELDAYHSEVEHYVNLLAARYADMCTVDGSFKW